MTMMRAVVLLAPGRTGVVEVPRPEPGSGEVRVKIEGCGVCASNLTPWSGPPWMRFPTAPGELGHEAWGTIDALGENVPSDLIGRRVALLSQRAYAEYDVAPADHVVGLPDALEGQPVPGEPLGCALNIFHRSGIEPGQTVAIVGIGFLGALLTRLAASRGATVIAISRREEALGLARSAGAAHTVSLGGSSDVVGAVRDLTGGRLCQRVIEAVGKQAPLDLAAQLTAERGRLVIAGYHQDGPRQVDMWLWNWRGLDVINAHERDPAIYITGMKEGIALTASGALDLRPLVTHRFPLDALGEALDATRDRSAGFVKAWIDPR